MSITGKLTSRILRFAALTIGSTTLKPTAAKLAGLLLLLLFASNSLFAQTSYPVQVNVVVTPPNSVYLTDYYTRGSEKLKVQLLLKEVSRPSFPVKIRFRIEGAALRLSSREGVNLPPFTLQGGTMVEASGDALAPYLSLSALVADGADASSFQSKGQRLADGFYKVEVWAEEMGRSVRVSNIATTYISTMLYQSPLVTIPMDKAVLPDQGIQNIVFQWMPRHLGASADAVLATYYKVRLVEVWPSSKDPQEAMRSSKPLYEGLCSSTAFVYGSGQPTLISGRKYALQVQAQDADQRDIFVNQGLSNVVSFTYGEECQIPQGLNVEVKGPNNAIVLWNANAKSSGYTLAYRKVYGIDTSYSEQPLGMPSYSMDNLLPLSSYQVRVAATCGLARSLWSQPRTFTTPGRADTKFECGKNPNIATVTDRTPKTTLAIGETIHAADFDVTVMAAELKNNAYSGGGITRIPFLRNAPAYCTLRDVKVNKDNQLFEGSVILADKLTVISDTMVNNAIRLGKDVVNSLKNKNPNTTVIVTPISSTITATSTTNSGGETFISGGKTTVSENSNNKNDKELSNEIFENRENTIIRDSVGSLQNSSSLVVNTSATEQPSSNIVVETHNTSNTKYGYDVVSNSTDEYISIMNNDEIEFELNIRGVDKIYLTVTDTVNFSILSPVDKIINNENRIVKIRSNNSSVRKQMLLQIRKDNFRGDVVKNINIISYKTVYADFNIYNIGSNDANISSASLLPIIEPILKQAVVKVNSISVQNVELSYDLNHNGKLDIYVDGDNPEMDIITNYTYRYGASNSMAIIDAGIQKTYRIRDSLRAGNNYILVRVMDGKIEEIGRWLKLGKNNSTQFEIVNVYRVVGDTIFINQRLENSYSTNDFVYRGILGLSSNPQIVVKSATFNKTIVHEKLHKPPFDLLDLDDDIENVMYFNSGNIDTKLRFRPQNIRITSGGGTENQWDKIRR